MGCGTADLPHLGQGLTEAGLSQTSPAPDSRGLGPRSPPPAPRHLAQQAWRDPEDAWPVRRGVGLLLHGGSQHHCLER